jgi:hypothetical protein
MNHFEEWEGELGQGPEFRARLGAFWDRNAGVVCVLALVAFAVYMAKTVESGATA